MIHFFIHPEHVFLVCTPLIPNDDRVKIVDHASNNARKRHESGPLFEIEQSDHLFLGDLITDTTERMEEEGEGEECSQGD